MYENVKIKKYSQKKIFKTVLNEIFEYNDDDFGNTKK